MKKYLIILFVGFTCISAQVTEASMYKVHSLIFPGWGEYELGESKRAQSFFIREAALWLLYVSNMKAFKWYESDYIAFAALHANVDIKQKSNLFAINLGHFDSLDEYNDSRERKRLPEEKYFEDEYQWEWDSKTNRLKYDEMRVKSGIARKNIRFVFGGLILHRVISFIDVIYLERQNQSFPLKSQLYGDVNNIELRFLFNF
ncbi:uncharacterized protein METZ01_LOCUS434725 [marine metagenome]|uniref:DUF5683 domain-containing protein n=1 Tax=marine metagenome TaxID=408172 RepID=A0A382YG35_9ZZZZ